MRFLLLTLATFFSLSSYAIGPQNSEAEPSFTETINRQEVQTNLAESLELFWLQATDTIYLKQILKLQEKYVIKPGASDEVGNAGFLLSVAKTAWINNFLLSQGKIAVALVDGKLAGCILVEDAKQFKKDYETTQTSISHKCPIF
ncbi:MAG: hypothetical protein HRU09_21095 [Oligoflexales bacterium]|nr:hypothetical protein [Oligoflexales bacterium]